MGAGTARFYRRATGPNTRSASPDPRKYDPARRKFKAQGSGLRAQVTASARRGPPKRRRCGEGEGGRWRVHRAELKKRPRPQANARGVSAQRGGERKEAPPSGVKEAPAAASDRRRRERAARWRTKRGSTERS